MKITWKEKYSVGVKEIDDQHKHFIDLLNGLFSAVSENAGPEKLKTLFQELSLYAQNHFATEEKYFDKFNYEGAAEHKLKHKEMLEDIKEIKDMKDKDAIDFYGSIVYFLIEWLDDHLEKVDQKYAECFRRHGLK